MLASVSKSQRDAVHNAERFDSPDGSADSRSAEFSALDDTESRCPRSARSAAGAVKAASVLLPTTALAPRVLAPPQFVLAAKLLRANGRSGGRAAAALRAELV